MLAFQEQTNALTITQSQVISKLNEIEILQATITELQNKELLSLQQNEKMRNEMILLKKVNNDVQNIQSENLHLLKIVRELRRDAVVAVASASSSNGGGGGGSVSIPVTTSLAVSRANNEYKKEAGMLLYVIWLKDEFVSFLTCLLVS